MKPTFGSSQDSEWSWKPGNVINSFIHSLYYILSFTFSNSSNWFVLNVVRYRRCFRRPLSSPEGDCPPPPPSLPWASPPAPNGDPEPSGSGECRGRGECRFGKFKWWEPKFIRKMNWIFQVDKLINFDLFHLCHWKVHPIWIFFAPINILIDTNSHPLVSHLICRTRWSVFAAQIWFSFGWFWSNILIGKLEHSRKECGGGTILGKCHWRGENAISWTRK